MKHLLITIFFSLIGYGLSAQVFPPDPLCAAGDTLFWDLPVNNCGPFESYDIFFSEDPGGPFSLLDNVTDPLQDFYLHLNPGNITYYYYMTSTHDCPGEPVLVSDTVSNIPPAVAPLLSVSVNGTDVELEWDPSPSPEVYAYVIYRLIGGNVDPIDTVFSGTTYVDTGAEPSIKSEQYYVLALDPCGNTSIFLNPHSTVYLSETQDACSRSVLLEWNPYQNFVAGLGSQEVWVSMDGGGFSLEASLDPTAEQYEFQVPEDGVEYCFYIRAVESGSDRGANSNVVCLQGDIVTPPDELTIFNATHTANGVEVSWLWNTDAEIAETFVEFTEVGSDNVVVSPWTSLVYPLELTNSELVPFNATGPVTYSVTAVDSCGDQWLSEMVTTIYLSGEAGQPGENALSWTPFQLTDADVEVYEIYRIGSQGTEYLGEVPGNQLEYDDFIPADALTQDPVCYYVEARFSRVLPDGSQVVTTSRSNTICLTPEPQMYIPNAFAPLGHNTIWRPFILYADSGFDYELQIYNRWGEMVFRTTDINEGWDGYFRGRLQPTGVYVYMFTLEGPGYERIVQKGDLVLVK